MTIHYPTPASSLPPLEFTWEDAVGNVIDFSGPNWTFQMKVGRPPNPSVLTKTSGIQGFAASPNLIVQWNPNELNMLTPGVWYLQVTATYGPTAQQRVLTGSLRIDQSTMA